MELKDRDVPGCWDVLELGFERLTEFSFIFVFSETVQLLDGHCKSGRFSKSRT